MTGPHSDAFENFTHSKRELARIDRILKLLREEWYKDPDTRLGQLVSNLAASAGWTGDDVFYVEDYLIEEELKARRRLDDQIRALELGDKIAKQVEDGTLGEDV